MNAVFAVLANICRHPNHIGRDKEISYSHSYKDSYSNYNSLIIIAASICVFQTNDQPDIEKEVRRLFRQDCEAIDVKWEVVIEDPTSHNPDAPEKQV